MFLTDYDRQRLWKYVSDGCHIVILGQFADINMIRRPRGTTYLQVLQYSAHIMRTLIF